MINAIFQYDFLQNAVISALLASIACGIIGTIIMEKKLVMMSGGIAHTAFGGIGLGYLLNIEPIIGGLFFSLLASIGIAKIHRKTNTYSDILIGMFWSFGMALGIIFITFTPGYPPDITSYLFGNILTVSKTDLIIIFLLNLIIIFVVSAYFNYYKAYLFDEEFAAVLDIPVNILEYILFILIALTVVVLIRIVGIILIIALLTAPASIAKQFTYNLKKLILLSVFLGAIFCLTGLWISYRLNIPSGASIIIISTLSYFIITIFNKNISQKFYKR